MEQRLAKLNQSSESQREMIEELETKVDLLTRALKEHIDSRSLVIQMVR